MDQMWGSEHSEGKRVITPKYLTLVIASIAAVFTEMSQDSKRAGQGKDCSCVLDCAKQEMPDGPKSSGVLGDRNQLLCIISMQMGFKAT